jgi:glucose-6-phosphate isomerase
MAQFLIVSDFLKKRLGESRFRQHLVMTTDPKSGTLRELCKEEGFESFEILKGVGGRFSVLSPVGLFPAAFLGVSLEELVEGAMHMDKRCRLEDLWTNPAGMLAVVSYLLQKNLRRSQMVILNYSESLQSTVDWFAQLWAESLGKKQTLKGEIVHAGLTPIAASGPRDQHSQVQLYVEGPRDKFVMLWQQERFERDISIPKIYSEKESLSYLGGKKLSEVLFAEILATEQTLRENGVPSFKMTTLDTGPYNLGQIFFLMEVATVYLGGLFGVNPYDQPGVELGKKFTYGKLGREGYEKFGGVLARKLKEKRYLV